MSAERFDVLALLAAKRIRLRPEYAVPMLLLFEHPGCFTSVEQLCQHAGVFRSTLGAQLRKKSMPPLQAWVTASRGIALVEALRAEPERSIKESSRECGYSDHSGLIHMLRDTFGVSAKQVRSRPGYDWLMERWWEREAERQAAREERKRARRLAVAR